MEALAGVASIGGIIQLTVHGIHLIKVLKAFARDCGHEVTQEFVHGLTTSAQLLQDVHALCSRVQKHHNPSISQIRCATLRLQLEDSIQDLESWNNAVKWFDHAPQRKYPPEFESSNGRGRYFRFLRIAFKHIGSVDRYRAIQARFDQHKNSIGVALAIFEADLQLVQVDAVEHARYGINKLVDLAESQERRQEQNYSDLRSSNSSLLAWSKTHEETLQELRSMQSSISDKMDNLILSLSSPNSKTTSVSSDCAPDVDPAAGRVGEIVFQSQEGLIWRETAQFNTEGVQPYSNLVSDLESDILEDDQGLQKVVHLFEDFHLLAGQHFDSLVAEYILATEKWRILQIREALLGAIVKNQTANRTGMNLDRVVDLPKVAAQILSLRRRAEVECLHESISEADALLDVDETQINEWELMAKQKSAAAGEEKLTLPDSSCVKSNDSLIRMNEWMFTVMTSIPYLAAWHRSLASIFIEGVRKGAGASTMDRDDWERLTMKFWLLDGTSLDAPDAYAASSFTSSRESELTVLAISSDEDDWIDNLRRTEDIAEGVLKQPVVDQRLLRGLKQLEAATEVMLPPPAVGVDLVDRARKALDAYAQEPSGRSWETTAD